MINNFYVTKLFMLILSLSMQPNINEFKLAEVNKLDSMVLNNYKEENNEFDIYEKYKTDKDKITIYCLGDSITQGIGADEIDYPSIVENETGLRVYNMGHGGDTTYDIALRSGAIKLEVESIENGLYPPNNNESLMINIKESDEHISKLFKEPDTNEFKWEDENNLADKIGNICNINGNTYEIVSSHENKGKYELKELKHNKDTEIKVGDNIEFAVPQLKESDIMILEMGSNGYWETTSQMVEQYRYIINYYESLGISKCLIIGDTDDPDDSYNTNQEALKFRSNNSTDWEKALENCFENRVFNARKYLLENGLKINSLEPTNYDEYRINFGKLPKRLRCKMDNTHLSDYGYKALGIGVVEKLKSLKWIVA